MSLGEDAADRSALYRLLGRLFLAEPDAALVGRLREWPAFGEALAGQTDEEAAARLRAEYARLFLLNVYPYESVFLDESVMLGAAPSVAVEAAYAAAGFEVSGVPRPGAADHVGAELWFVATLIDGAPAAVQRRFLETHLAAFVAPFAWAVGRDARHPFYRVLAEVTVGVVLGDLARLGAASLPLAAEAGPADTAAPPRAALGDADLEGVGRYLATPLLAGLFLSRETLHRLAGRLALPLALLERHRMIELLFEGAARFGQLPALLELLEAEARAAGAYYAARAAEHPGAAAALDGWTARAAATADALLAMRREAAR